MNSPAIKLDFTWEGPYQMDARTIDSLEIRVDAIHMSWKASIDTSLPTNTEQQLKCCVEALVPSYEVELPPEVAGDLQIDAHYIEAIPSECSLA